MNQSPSLLAETPTAVAEDGATQLIEQTGKQAGAERLGKPGRACRRDRSIPSYLREVYGWAYLNSRSARFLDHELVVSALLWGNSKRLRRALLAEITAGMRVMQAAHVYGELVPQIAKAVGPAGRFDVIDVAPLQAALCRRKLRAFSNTRVRIADAMYPGDETYDVVVCFFLLHELPDTYKCAVVNALLTRLSTDGKAVFIDYHAPAPWHPLRGLMRQVFARLEPFAEAMWHHNIAEFARYPNSYVWRTETCFGGLYQKTVASRSGPSPRAAVPDAGPEARSL